MGILINSFCIPQIHLSHYILLPPHVTSSEEISPCSEAFPRCGPPVVRLLITPVYSLPWPPHPGLSPADLISLCSPPSLLQPPWPLALLQHTNFTPASRPSCVLSALSRRSFQVLPGSLPNSVPSSAKCHLFRVPFPAHRSEWLTSYPASKLDHFISLYSSS